MTMAATIWASYPIRESYKGPDGGKILDSLRIWVIDEDGDTLADTIWGTGGDYATTDTLAGGAYGFDLVWTEAKWATPFIFWRDGNDSAQESRASFFNTGAFSDSVANAIADANKSNFGLDSATAQGSVIAAMNADTTINLKGLYIRATGNDTGFISIGSGTGPGAFIMGGATGHGLFTRGQTSGAGLYSLGGSGGGSGIYSRGQGTAGHGAYFEGITAGNGIFAEGNGLNYAGFNAFGDALSYGAFFHATGSDGIRILGGDSASNHGAEIMGGFGANADAVAIRGRSTTASGMSIWSDSAVGLEVMGSVSYGDSAAIRAFTGTGTGPSLLMDQQASIDGVYFSDSIASIMAIIRPWVDSIDAKISEGGGATSSNWSNDQRDSVLNAIADANKSNFKADVTELAAIADSVELYDTRFDSLLNAISDANKSNFMADVSDLSTILTEASATLDSLQLYDTRWDSVLAAIDNKDAFKANVTGLGDTANNIIAIIRPWIDSIDAKVSEGGGATSSNWSNDQRDSVLNAIADANKGNFKANVTELASIADSIELYDTRFDSLLAAVSDVSKANYKADVSDLATILSEASAALDSLQLYDTRWDSVLAAIDNKDAFKANVTGLSTFDPTTDLVTPTDTNASGATIARTSDSTAFQGDASGLTASAIWSYATADSVLQILTRLGIYQGAICDSTLSVMYPIASKPKDSVVIYCISGTDTTRVGAVNFKVSGESSSSVNVNDSTEFRK